MEIVLITRPNAGSCNGAIAGKARTVYLGSVSQFGCSVSPSLPSFPPSLVVSPRHPSTLGFCKRGYGYGKGDLGSHRCTSFHLKPPHEPQIAGCPARGKANDNAKRV